MKKRIMVCIPCYNEEENVRPITEELIGLFEGELSRYDYGIQFIDNNSTDSTQAILRRLCSEHAKVRAILNARNFPLTSGFHGLMQSDGDCTISIPADFQVPLALISRMVEEWEKGARIVCLIKKSSEEKKLMWNVRQLYYRLANKFSDTEIIRNFTGSGLYDKGFLDLCRTIDDPVISFGQIVSTLGYDIRKIEYMQPSRKRGRSKNNLFTLMEIALSRFTNSSNIGPRFAAMIGVAIGVISFLIGLIYLILKILFWKKFPVGIAPIIIGIFFMGGIQLFFLGLLGEYVVKMNTRLMKRPIVVERERINFRKKAVHK